MYNFTVFYTCIYFFIFFIIIHCDMSHVLEINYLILSYLILIATILLKITPSYFKLYILDLIILCCLKSTFANRPIQKLLLANLHAT